jgi:hypothetical protein
LVIDATVGLVLKPAALPSILVRSNATPVALSFKELKTGCRLTRQKCDV